MRICFENSIGRVELGDGSEFGIIEVEGLDFQPRVRNMTALSGLEGEYCIGESRCARVITIKGDIKSGARIIRDMVRVFEEKGILRIRTGLIEREIGAICTGMEIADKGKVYKSVIMQFGADCPYFEDYRENRINIFRREKLIKTPFILPMMFSKRECSADIYNVGDVKCEPVFEIYSHSESDGCVVIENATTGKSVTIQHGMKKGEKIVADIKNRTVSSDIDGEILYKLSDESYLSDMMLVKGKNSLNVTNDSGGEISVVCRYKNRYGECIVG